MSDVQRNGATEQDVKASIEDLETRIIAGKDAVQEWTRAGQDLSQSAAEARAKNQGAGRGVGGALLGSKFRALARKEAAASNAAIAKAVAEKRADITNGKRAAQEHVKALRVALGEAKAALRELKARSKAEAGHSASASKSLTLLRKLKEAHDLGLLTDEEYESKRQSHVDAI